MYNAQNNGSNPGIPPELQSMIMNYSGQPSAADPQQQQQQLYLHAMLLQRQQQQQQQQLQQQQQTGAASPYDSPQMQMQRAKSGASETYGSASSSPSMHNMPQQQRFGSPLANQAMTSPQQAKAQKEEQARQQSAGTPRQPSATSAESPTANDTALNAKRVSAVSFSSRHNLFILALNQELFRACVELSQDPNAQPTELSLYQARLQSNLTYLATMADISVKPAEVSCVLVELYALCSAHILSITQNLGIAE
ncbi:hypothetical protein INT44_007331 [Umbelopsis vinacea]|uniref:Uncharacterized protein n=1 Tax=Umbelopsis vinacea TaxID=44442 RepID=A0A8H7PMA0_9FUNG|nr:hypothetical protein INT44_007331 [Umbelopsis vinacea]